ncbi:hypothetical protein [Streptomyces sp. NPDC051310]|uniref:hypothetical protein n=1 Tax=Streptomyces sp. NPDC051310 TaxID=3365649 RepID=UPI003798E14A
MGPTLIVTNYFPPRQGGIDTFVHALATRIAGNDVVVYTSSEPGAAVHDTALPFPVIKDPTRVPAHAPRGREDLGVDASHQGTELVSPQPH